MRPDEAVYAIESAIEKGGDIRYTLRTVLRSVETTAWEDGYVTGSGDRAQWTARDRAAHGEDPNV